MSVLKRGSAARSLVLPVASPSVATPLSGVDFSAQAGLRPFLRGVWQGLGDAAAA